MKVFPLLLPDYFKPAVLNYGKDSRFDLKLLGKLKQKPVNTK